MKNPTSQTKPGMTSRWHLADSADSHVVHMGGPIVTSRMTVTDLARARIFAKLFDVDIQAFGSALPYLEDGTVFIHGGAFHRRLLV